MNSAGYGRRGLGFARAMGIDWTGGCAKDDGVKSVELGGVKPPAAQQPKPLRPPLAAPTAAPKPLK